MERIKALQRQIVGDLDYLHTLMDKEVLAHCSEELEKDPLDSDACSVAFFSEDLQSIVTCLPQI